MNWVKTHTLASGLATATLFYFTNALAVEHVNKNDVCINSSASRVCISTRRAGFNFEIKANFEANPSAVFRMLRSAGIASNALLACRVFVNRPEFQKQTVLHELVLIERDALEFSRISDFELLPNGDVRCEYLGQKLFGAPGAYAIWEDDSFERKGSISQCLPEIARIANDNNLTLLRQTRETVAFKFPDVSDDVSDGSFGCSWAKPIINLTARYKSCKPPAHFYEDLTDLLQVKPKMKRTMMKHLEDCTRRAERAALNYLTRRHGFESTCTFVPPRNNRASDCEVGISIYPRAD